MWCASETYHVSLDDWLVSSVGSTRKSPEPSDERLALVKFVLDKRRRKLWSAPQRRTCGKVVTDGLATWRALVS
ncbi:hypothetical protein L484_026759 [Morus notabilis]|uniref:Transposase n=1 Tax=Morus notabilis TaxID=981085 RepID=W9SN76_9ROSA|nr:hypothetical protein L484_026759 [Morus notabilis]